MIRTAPDLYQVAVPSWNRADLLATTTLALLRERHVDLARVTVFLDADDPRLHAYASLAEDYLFSLVVSKVKGINAQRRVISEHYAPGTPVVCLDDDVSDVVRATDPKTLAPVLDLDTFFRDAFIDTAAHDLYVWGVSAVTNAFFMQAKPSVNLKFLIATLWGFYSRPGHPVHDTRVEVKEDYEQSLRAWFYDGGVYRLNDVSAKADHYKAAGGCQDYRDPEASRLAAAQLMEDWPDLVRLNTKRKSGHAEILLARRDRHAGNPVATPPPGRVITGS
jgi:hypothetical protein